ncbi:uncharacterized protein LOC106668218 [Cimex lectularius]|uniref:Cyclic nucleotide-binding domain-containing protein n=1 Tax=Cimex lectularius TaxID=79782 RepID=A0A8I6RTK2_CIMLE|nr:uncharacterized protein LOC106668218 [Cimex lectularius]
MFKKAVKAHFIKKKPSLSQVLHETLQLQWDEIKSSMNKFSYFKHWSSKAIHQFCVHSNIVRYNPDDVIRVKDDTNVFVTHFILEGSVTVIQRILVKKILKKGDKHAKFILYKDQNADTNKKNNLHNIFMQTCHLFQGACFGLGETLSNHIIKANKGLKCLVVPRFILFQDYTPDNIWRRIIMFLDMNYPTLEEVFREFVNGRRWAEFSEDLYLHKFGEKKVLVDSVIHDVPISLRGEDLYLLNELNQI